MTELADIAEEVALLDAILEPIANQPADINDPDWMERPSSADLLAEAGIKPEVHGTLRALITHYAEGDKRARQTVRAIFERYRAFRWAAHIPDSGSDCCTSPRSTRDPTPVTRSSGSRISSPAPGTPAWTSSRS